MILVNQSPYVAETFVDKDAELNQMLVVVVKATFAFDAQGRVSPATQQLPFLFGDEMTESEPIPAVRFESDLVPFKPHGDFVVVGHAVSAQPVTEVDAGFRMGAMEKIVKVFGDRVWQSSGVFGGIGPSPPEPFTEMELTFDRAFGGFDANRGDICHENICGKGILSKKTKKEEIAGTVLPNMERAEALIKTWKDKPDPIGMGFLAKGSAQRMAYIGTHDDAWKDNRSPDRPVDFDFRYFNAAPVDQQIDGYFAGNEIIELLNMTPDHHQIRFQLPDRHPRAFAKSHNSTLRQPVALNLDTVCVVSKEQQVYLVWRGWIPVGEGFMQDMESITVEPH